MFELEFEPIYEIFEGESMLALFSARCAGAKPSWAGPLLEALRLFYGGSFHRVPSEALPSIAVLSERNLTAALRHWTRAGILRHVSYRPAVYRFQDPVPLDAENLLRYNPFAGEIAKELRMYRDPLPYEIQMAYAWKTYPGLGQEAILEVIHQTLERNPNAGLKSAEPLLPLVRGASTRREAAEVLAEETRLREACGEVLLRLGQDREPSAGELEMYTAWVREWGFTREAVLEACAAAARGNPTFAYLNGILRNIHQQSGKKDTLLDIGDVEASFQVNEEYREILRYAGGGRAARYREEYLQLREQFPHELVVLAARESGRAGAGFEGILKRLRGWERQGLISLEEVNAHLAESRARQNLMTELYALWGMEGKPTPRDLRLAGQWLRAGYSREQITAAAETALHAKDPPLYTAKVLRRLQEK